MTKKKIDKPTSLEDVVHNMNIRSDMEDVVRAYTQTELEHLYPPDKKWDKYFPRNASQQDRLNFISSPCQGHDTETQKEEARVFESGMKRDNDDNKPYVHNLQGYTRLRFGYLTRMGAVNYGDGNFLLGSPSADALKSLDRHLARFLDGDRSEDHLSAIIFNVQLVMLNEKREGIPADHYFKPAIKQ